MLDLKIADVGKLALIRQCLENFGLTARVQVDDCLWYTWSIDSEEQDKWGFDRVDVEIWHNRRKGSVRVRTICIDGNGFDVPLSAVLDIGSEIAAASDRYKVYMEQYNSEEGWEGVFTEITVVELLSNGFNEVKHRTYEKHGVRFGTWIVGGNYYALHLQYEGRTLDGVWHSIEMLEAAILRFKREVSYEMLD
jgi:hypothetical protein